MSNVELWERLPEASSARQQMMGHIDDLVDRLVTDEQTKRRNWSDVLGSYLFALGGAYLACRAIVGDGWSKWARQSQEP